MLIINLKLITIHEYSTNSNWHIKARFVLKSLGNNLGLGYFTKIIRLKFEWGNNLKCQLKQLIKYFTDLRNLEKARGSIKIDRKTIKYIEYNYRTTNLNNRNNSI